MFHIDPAAPRAGDLIVSTGDDPGRGVGNDSDYPLLITQADLMWRDQSAHGDIVDVRIISLDSFGTRTTGWLVAGDKLTLLKRDGTTGKYCMGTHIYTTWGVRMLVAKSWRLEGRIFS